MNDYDPVHAIGRDPDTFEAFYRDHVEAGHRFVARRVDDPHTTADVTADVFLAAVRGSAGYRSGRGSPRAWLYPTSCDPVPITASDLG